MLKSQLNLSIPGKTFLMGEYLALSGGPSLVVAALPAFRFDFYVGHSEDLLHPESPAGLLLQKIKSEIGSLRLEMHDPYHGRGGFGASTAQFLALWLYARALNKKAATDIDAKIAGECWDEYQKLFSGDVKPSGADLVNQMSGGLTAWNAKTRDLLRLDWPFPDLRLHLFKTNHKVKTHEHLQQIDLKKIPMERLCDILEVAIQAAKEKNSSQFLRQSILYTEALRDAKLQDEKTIDLMEKISLLPDVLSVRGCGALGADVMVVYTSPRIDLDLSDYDLLKVATLPEQLSSGPVWRWS